MLTLAVVSGPVDAAPLKREIAARTVALMPYRGKDPSWRAGATASGVLIGPKHILASAEALRRSHGRLFAKLEPKMPDRVIAAIRVKDAAVLVECVVVPGADDAPFRVLEIAAADRAKLGKAGSKRLTTGEMSGEGTLAASVFAPEGLPPAALAPGVVPEPHGVALRLGDTATRLDLRTEVTAIRQPLPPITAGAGVWEGDTLVGALLRRGEGWFIVGAEAFESLIPEQAPIVGPDPPKPPDPPDPPTPEPPKIAPLVSPQLAPAMARLIKEIGGKLTIDPGFVDHVGQDQADMAMAMLAGGQPDKALELIEDILFLTRGKLAEQLTYRRALALAVKGHAKEALQDAQKMLTAEDPQVAGRARMLAAALGLVEDGKFDGKPISDPSALRGAVAAALGKIHKRFADKAADVLALDPETPLAKDRARTLLYELNDYRHVWPGYFDKLAGKLAKVTGDGE